MPTTQLGLPVLFEKGVNSKKPPRQRSEPVLTRPKLISRESMGQDFPPKAIVTSTVVSQAKEKTGHVKKRLHARKTNIRNP